MPSQSEKSFGAKLRAAQNLYNIVGTFTNYNPPRPEESLRSFGNLLADVTQANSTETISKQNYNTATIERRNAFKANPDSIKKILAPIRGIILAQYGRNSTQFKQISTIIFDMRKGETLKTYASDEVTVLSTFSQSQQSYGSLAKGFNDLVNTLINFGDFNPSNYNLQIAQLQTKAQNSTTLSDTVIQTFQRISQAKDQRNQIYTELSQRAERIKSYILSEYGYTSNEYKLIKGLSI